MTDAFVRFAELQRLTGYETKAAVSRWLRDRKIRYHPNRYGEPFTSVEAFNLKVAESRRVGLEFLIFTTNRGVYATCHLGARGLAFTAVTRLLILLLSVLATAAKLLGPGGARAVIAENLLLKQQLLVVCRPRRRAPSLSIADRFVLGLCALFSSTNPHRQSISQGKPSILMGSTAFLVASLRQ